MGVERNVKLFRDGEGQAVHIPRDFELPGDVAVMRKEGNRLVIEAKTTGKKTMKSLVEWLATLEPVDEEFPEIPDPTPDPVDI